VRGDELAALALQLRDCQVALRRNEMVLARGVGANALDHPALALVFLADMVARQPQFDALAAGEIITTGTLTAAMPIKAGETWSSSYTGLPGVSGLQLTLVE
jgi:2-oxo-3-hexenedioate decarboxylase